MKKRLVISLSALMILSEVFYVGCDWSSGDSGFNTSASIEINVSGFYRGILGGNFAVLRKNGGAVTSFVLQQSGNVLEVTDSNGQRYSGNVGAPSTTLNLATTTVADGASVANFQITWAGRDGTAATDIEFTGVIDMVAVGSVVGQTQASTPNAGGSSNDQVDTSAATQTREFVFAEGNSQFRLQGTWIESAGGSSPVEALAPGAGILQLQGLASVATVTAPTITPNQTIDIAINPNIATLNTGQSQAFTASTTSGNVVSPTWSLSNTSIGTLSSTSGQNVTYSATGPGTQVITIVDSTFGTATETFTQTSTLSISPTVTRLSVGNTQVFLASGGTGSYTWSLRNSTIGTLSATSGSQITYSATATGAQVITVSDGVSTVTRSITQL